MGLEPAQFVLRLTDHRQEQIWAVTPDSGYRRIPDDDEDPSRIVVLWDQIVELATRNLATVEQYSESRKRDGGPSYHDGRETYDAIQYLVATFGAGGAAWMFLQHCKPLLMQWLKNKQSRRITAKLGEIEITVNGSNDIERLLDALKQFQAVRVPSQADEHEPTTPNSRPAESPSESRSGRKRGRRKREDGA